MALSDSTAHESAKVLRKHVNQKTLAKIIDELLEDPRRQGFPRYRRAARAGDTNEP